MSVVLDKTLVNMQDTSGKNLQRSRKFSSWICGLHQGREERKEQERSDQFSALSNTIPGG